MTKERFQGLNKSETILIKLIKQEAHKDRINPGSSRTNFTLDEALEHNSRLRNYERSAKTIRRLTNELSIQNKYLFNAWTLFLSKPDMESPQFRLQLLKDHNLRRNISLIDQLRKNSGKKTTAT